MSYLLIKGDARRIPLADGSVHCCVTSPPYYALRNYGVAGQIGLEETPGEYIAATVRVFREVWRVLRDDGTLWLNVGDSYNQDTKWGGSSSNKNETKQGYPRKSGKRNSGCKPKDLIGIPWMLAFALRDDGWYLRQENIWDKPNSMPESVRDRPSRAHEQVFLLSKSPRYYYDDVAGRNPQKTLGRRHEGKSGYREGHPSKGGIKARSLNPLGGAVRSVWRISSRSFKGAHFATMPVELAGKCIKLGSSSRGCCPACGSPWVQVVDRERVATRPGTNSKVVQVARNGLGHPIHHPEVVGNRDPKRHTTVLTPIGWESSCSCLEPTPVPCIVFDPFSGAATTGVASEALGRHFIGMDLSPEYLTLGADRLSRPHAPVRASASSPRSPLPLFDRKPRAIEEA